MNDLPIFFRLPFAYYVYVVTFIAFPILAVLLSKRLGVVKTLKWVKITFPFILIYKFADWLGYTFYGDHIDYTILGLCYFWLCFLVNATKISTATPLKVLRVICYVVITVFGAITFFTSFIFPISVYAVQDYDVWKKVYFVDNEGKRYEVRCYEYGGVFDMDSKYTFKTYRCYTYLPIEKEIDISVFIDTRTDLRIKGNLNFSINNSSSGKVLRIVDEQGKYYEKVLK